MTQTEHTQEQAITLLHEKGIQPSFQRVNILAYMLQSDDHPTADHVHLALSNLKPAISLATVYNTLNLFSLKGLLRRLDIDESKIHYDAVCEDHGHFLCLQCGQIYNFELRLDALVDSIQGGFKVQDKAIYFKGICPECQQVNTGNGAGKN